MQIKNKHEERLLKLLMDNKHVNSGDILSHKWSVFISSDEELWLICNNCNFYYSVSAFSNGSIIRFFVSDINAKESIQMMNCNACKMHNAIS